MPRWKLTPNVDRHPRTRPYLRDEPVTSPEMWHLAEGGTLPGRLWFRLSRLEDGRWICTDLEIEGNQPLTTSVLRGIPLTRIVTEFLARPWPWQDRGGALRLDLGLRQFYDTEWNDLPDEAVRDFYLASTPTPRATRTKRKRGGVGPSEDDLRKFREVYTWALQKHSRRPVAATAEKLNISAATVYRWREIAGETL